MLTLGHPCEVGAEHLSKGIGTGLLSRQHNLIPLCTNRLGEDDSGQVVGEETPILCDILRNIKAICDAKWRIFQNEGAEQRVLEINTLLERIQGA